MKQQFRIGDVYICYTYPCIGCM